MTQSTTKDSPPSNLESALKKLLQGEVSTAASDLAAYSHDASMFELRPQAVVWPQNSSDVKALVKFVSQRAADFPGLALTARSGGTDMSGGAIGEGLVVDFSRHFNRIGKVTATWARTQPGVFYRDFEAATLAQNALLPTYPASRELCTVGGMVANNAGGEKSLTYGKTEKFIEELSVVLADGNEYVLRPLEKTELAAKLAQDDWEGELYRQLHTLLEKNYDAIQAARPRVSKDSTGYHLWNVWDRERGVLDLTKLFAGSQGTLGLVTDIKFRLAKHQPHSGTLVVFLRKTERLGELINKVLESRPTSFEAFDNYTLMLSFKLFFYFRKNLGWGGLLKLGLQLLPDLLKLTRGIPKMILLIEFSGHSAVEVANKVHFMHAALAEFGADALFEENASAAEARKFWIMRRESFNLLRQKVKDKHTAPFIDDLVVPPQHLPEFLPKVRAIINKYGLLATVAGHMGDGNFHIIPLMNIELESERAKLEPAMREVNELVLSYGGSLSGEHNDGMIRGPWLEAMYGPEMLGLFREVKRIFDPENIFNPHKKTDADWQFSKDHIRQNFD